MHKKTFGETRELPVVILLGLRFINGSGWCVARGVFALICTGGSAIRLRS